MGINTSYIVLFNMNKFAVEKKENIDLDADLKVEMDKILLNKKDKFLKDKGLQFSNLVLKISNKSDFFLYIIKHLFKNHEIRDCQYVRDEVGHPDFVLIDNETGEKIYLEIKFREDSLRLAQLEWFANNKDKNCKILWIYTNFYGESFYEGISDESSPRILL